jgi:hypothetical protein
MKKNTRAKANGAQEKFAAPAGAVGGLKLKPAAAYLGGLSVPTMHRLCERGLLRPNRSLRCLIFAKSELDRFLRDGMTE